MGEDVLDDGVEGGDGVAGEEELLEAGVGGEAGAGPVSSVAHQHCHHTQSHGGDPAGTVRKLQTRLSKL